jgi:DNA polymerase III gamma/tau subunit
MNNQTELTLLEKYFPKNFDELFLPAKIKEQIINTKNKSSFRLLFFSGPGTGKTTTANLLTKSEDNEIMYLSGSNDFNVELYRSKVMPFCAGMSVLNKKKVLVIDESENISDKIQDAFKILMDKAKNVNFIFITNEKAKIIEPLLSRFTQIDFDFVGTNLEEQKKNFITFALKVCNENNIKFDNPGMKELFRLNYPDFRHLLVLLDAFKDLGQDITLDSVKSMTESGKPNLELYEIIENRSLNGKELFTALTKFKGKEKECFLSLGEPFFNYLNTKELYSICLDSAIIISKYSDNYYMSINKFVTFFSCIVELKNLLK